MAKVVGDVAVSVGADISPLKRGMREGTAEVQKFGRDFDATSKQMRAMAGKVAASIGAIAAASAAVGSAGQYVIEFNREIETLSRVAGVGAERFQTLAYAAREYGIDQEKLSDILKDVNDRIGDFISTGGGPMLDFFEQIAPKVGVTIEQFRRLNSADALALYVDTLQKANVSQAEMTFYLEALAGDATRLAPLFANNAAEMQRLEQTARDLGVVIGEDLISRTSRMHTVWNTLVDSMRAKFVSFASNVMIGLDHIFGITDEGQLANMRDQLSSLTDEYGELHDRLAALSNRSQSAPEGSTASREVERVRAAIDATREEMNLVNEGMLAIQTAKSEREKAKADLEAALAGDGAGGDVPEGGGGRKQDPREKLEQLVDTLATEREIIQADFDERLAQLEAFREAEVVKEEEYAETKRRIQEDYYRSMSELEAKDRRAKLQAMSGVFGDLSALMATENKKLFNIGKAASIAKAVVDGYEAATTAWRQGMTIGGPPVAAAFTAASLAKTGALIASIASTQISGSGGGGGGRGGGGGGGASSTPAADPAEATAPRQVNISMGDGEWFPRSALENLAERLQELSREGAVVTVR